MKNRILGLLLGAAAVVSLAGTAALSHSSVYASYVQQVGGTPTATTAFADPAFQKVWERTDRPVAYGQVGRTWFWGPNPRQVVQEGFAEGPNGMHKVQYFDKSRMEINDPSADPNSAFYVTNGLLTVELMSGRMQVGVSSFIDRYPANINIAGDNDDPTAPTYASFRTVANVAPGVGRRDQNRMGQAVTASIDRAGNVTDDPSKATVDGVAVSYYEGTTGHNIPAKFWNFLNQSGPIYKDGNLVTELLITPWFYASGLPVSDAYWAKVKVAGQLQDVLIQAFERRVLTYNPANAPAWQVEMGNIGLHYYDWRYNNAGQPPVNLTSTVVPSSTATGAVPTATGTPATATATTTGTTVATTTATPIVTNTPSALSGKIAFVSERTGNQDIWMMNADGTVPQNLTLNPASDIDPAWSPDGSKLAFASNRTDNAYNLYILNMTTLSITQITAGTFESRQPSWSPDGAKIAFRSNREGDNEIFTINADGSGLRNITKSAGNDSDPDWNKVDGNKIAFKSDRLDGSDQIYMMHADGTGVTKLTDRGPHNFLPSWSPDGRKILFISDRTGNANQEIWVMDGDGSKPIRLTDWQSMEWDASWSPDGSRITFASDRDGNLEIYYTNINTPDDTQLIGGDPKRITIETTKDYRPVWKK